jgi:choline dehydrogenase-like flavoprotein
MATSAKAQNTDFSHDTLGRFICNGLDEALASTDKPIRPDARPFDVIILGGGTFGAALAQHMFHRDVSHRHRILVLEAGPFSIPEHVQNVPVPGIDAASPTSIADLRAQGIDRQARNEVWGLAWHSDVPNGFPGLAYTIGGRSLYWGGWSPQPLDTEIPSALWPADVVNALKTRYFRESAEQLGVTETNDFIRGALHDALREQLYAALLANKITDAVQPADLPQVIDVPMSAAVAAAAGAAPAIDPTLTAGAAPPAASARAADDIWKLEAPLAVQSRASRAGFFPTNKFSATPLLARAARLAQAESLGDDVKKRLMVVPNCHVKRLVPSGQDGWRITTIETNFGPINLSPDAVVVVAQGTIESTRQVLNTFDSIPPEVRPSLPIGQNLMAHLRSNLDIRVRREALEFLGSDIKELETSALFVKGKHQFADGSVGHFHLQITASGLGALGSNSEAELFRKIPDIDGFEPFRNVTDSHVVITMRGIGEMEPKNPNSFVNLDSEPDEYGVRRAFVRITPSAKDNELWNAMDSAAMDVANAFGGTWGFEILGNRRDGLGTTHHEGGTLAMGAVTDSFGKVQSTANLYAAGPALFPSLGSPNPMLTGIALVRRLGDELAKPVIPPLEPGFTPLFNGADLSKWRMTRIRNQPGRDNPGLFQLVNGAIESVPGTDIGLFWCTTPTPANFILKLEFALWQADANSGVFLRFPNPEKKNYNNAAFVAVDFGFEVQIDDFGAPDGAAMHRTGSIYAQPAQTYTHRPTRGIGNWNDYEIRVQDQTYTVFLNGQQTTRFVNSDGARGLPGSAADPAFIGFQTHSGRVAFRNVRIKAT